MCQRFFTIKLKVYKRKKMNFVFSSQAEHCISREDGIRIIT